MEKIIAKDWLNRANNLNIKINNKNELIIMWREQKHSISPIVASNAVGGIHNKVKDLLLKIADKNTEIEQDIITLTEIKLEISNMIKNVPDEMQQVILEQRYVLCKDWPEIEQSINYQKSHLHNIHNNALLEIEQLLKHWTVLE